jgi:hypothetical protein
LKFSIADHWPALVSGTGLAPAGVAAQAAGAINTETDKRIVIVLIGQPFPLGEETTRITWDTKTTKEEECRSSATAQAMGATVGRSSAVHYWETDTVKFRAAGMAARNLTVAPIE